MTVHCRLYNDIIDATTMLEGWASDYWRIHKPSQMLFGIIIHTLSVALYEQVIKFTGRVSSGGGGEALFLPKGEMARRERKGNTIKERIKREGGMAGERQSS